MANYLIIKENKGQALQGGAITCIDCFYIDINNSNFIKMSSK
jgi:hypothetical protein